MTKPSTSCEKRQALSAENKPKNCKQCGREFLARFKHRHYCEECPPSKRPKYGAKAKVERICAVCKKKFTPRNERFRVCSKDCSIEYKRMMKNQPILPRPCSQCGEEFTPTGNLRACYCSSKCGSKAGYLRAKERAKGGATAKKEAQCAKCGEPFEKYNNLHVFCEECSPSKKKRNQQITRICGFCEKPFAMSGKGNHVYCPECRAEHPHNMIHKSNAPCENCGEHFTHVNKEARFCSHSCSSTWLNQAGLGPRHDDAELLAILVKVIKDHDECLSMEELAFLAGTSPVVFAPRSWTMEGLYQTAGRIYEKPRFRSRFEDRVYAVLCELVDESKIEPQKPLPGMRGVKGGCQLADFYIDELGLIVEVDGNHHREPHWGPETLEYVQANDRQKDAYANANGITLVRIPHTENRRTIKARLLRTIRHLRPRPAALNPSNHLLKDSHVGTTDSKCRTPKRGETRDRPNPVTPKPSGLMERVTALAELGAQIKESEAKVTEVRAKYLSLANHIRTLI